MSGKCNTNGMGKQPTDLLHNSLAMYLDILRMTQSETKFPSWVRQTVVKAFKWTEALIKAMNGHDSNTIHSILQNCNLKQLPNFFNQHAVVDEPVQMLLQAILESPYLSWLSESKQTTIVDESIALATKSIGEAAVQNTLARCMTNAVLLRRHKLSQTNAGDDEFSRTQHEMLGTDLLIALHRARLNNSHGEFLDKLRQIAFGDPTTFQILCTAVAMTPARIASVAPQLESELSNDAIGAIIDEGNALELWDILLYIARRSPLAFSLIGMDFELLKKLIQKRLDLSQAIAYALIEGTGGMIDEVRNAHETIESDSRKQDSRTSGLLRARDLMWSLKGYILMHAVRKMDGNPNVHGDEDGIATKPAVVVSLETSISAINDCMLSTFSNS